MKAPKNHYTGNTKTAYIVINKGVKGYKQKL